MSERTVSPWLFPGVGAVLYALLILSFILSYVDLGWLAVPVALAIALTQAVLVTWFSMELFESRFSVRILAIIAPLFVVLFVTLVAVDVATRAPQPLLVPTPDRSRILRSDARSGG